jgi:hypothetical protein
LYKNFPHIQNPLRGNITEMQSNWVQLAIGSGICAAVNGLFAKLTTTTLTSSLASALATALGIGEGGGSKFVEVAVRGVFFLLNLLFNGIVWRSLHSPPIEGGAEKITG